MPYVQILLSCNRASLPWWTGTVAASKHCNWVCACLVEQQHHKVGSAQHSLFAMLAQSTLHMYAKAKAPTSSWVNQRPLEICSIADVRWLYLALNTGPLVPTACTACMLPMKNSEAAAEQNLQGSAYLEQEKPCQAPRMMHVHAELGSMTVCLGCTSQQRTYWKLLIERFCQQLVSNSAFCLGLLGFLLKDAWLSWPQHKGGV